MPLQKQCTGSIKAPDFCTVPRCTVCSIAITQRITYKMRCTGCMLPCFCNQYILSHRSLSAFCVGVGVGVGGVGRGGYHQVRQPNTCTNMLRSLSAFWDNFCEPILITITINKWHHQAAPYLNPRVPINAEEALAAWHMVVGAAD